MKRLMLFVAVMLLSLPAFALDGHGREKTNVLDDVIRMSQAGVSDDAIISYVVHAREPFEATADDIIALTNAHVSKDVIKAIVDEAADRKERRVERRDDSSTRERVVVAPYYGGYYGGYYDPFYYGRFYDPFVYSPRVFVGFGFGRFHGGGHGFRHGRH
jgi:hypothetical protein